MSRSFSLTAALAIGTFSLALPAWAQEPEPPTPPTPPDVHVFRMQRGAMIGLMLDGRADDSLGARVQRVIPDSPADSAGIRPGDIIVRFNTTPLAGGDVHPARRLSQLARDLEPGDSARLEYRRDGETETVTVVARELDRAAFTFAAPAIAAIRPHLEEMRRHLVMARGMRGLELVDLNPGLGEYFGTKEGVLVVDTRDDKLPLRPGDVLVRIDGRTPRDAAHAERILSTYRPGEEAKLDILRKQERETVTWTVPERDRERARESRRRAAPPRLMNWRM